MSQFKYENTRIVQVQTCCEIPQGEFDILVSYARGLSMRQICIETGCDIKTVFGIVRRNLLMLLDTKGL